MASHMDATSLERFLVHILTPVYRLIEDDTIRDSQMGKFFILFSNYRY
jgi:U3 small nucleolar RNA-associated protein 20